jgi:uncharacterized phage protein gp47/JayE
MQLPLITFTVLLQRMAATLQGSATSLVDLSVGSVLRASLEASASVALWMQWLILQVLAVTRAATSTAADLDSWMADFSLVRLPGSPASGIVTFGRYTPGVQASIASGSIVRTNDGTQSFTVVSQPSSPAWNGNSGYTLAASDISLDLPVVALSPGAAGNVQAGAIGLLAVPLAGIDTVVNAAAFAGGLDSETDTALRGRFQAYINSRSLATPQAISFAISSVRQGLRFAVLENVNQAGDAAPGNFTVIVDDGTGMLTSELAASVAAAVEAVRPIGSTYSVTPPSLIYVDVQMTLQTSNVATHQAVAALVQSSVVSWIAALPIAGTLAVSKLEAIAHSCDPSVTSVTGTTINQATLDVTAPENGVFQPVIVSVS